MGVFLAAVFLPFMGKAFHNDEPFFLAAAQHVLVDPLHPLAFSFTWYGRLLPAAQINTTPPALFYLLAAAVRLSGQSEFATRLTLFPLDLAAALGLYLLASRFLKSPLLPTLIAIATPAYLINMNHLMPEKLAGALGFWGLYSIARGVDEKDPSWFWGSAALLGAAAVSKYNAALFLIPAAVYGWRRGVRPIKLFAFLAAAAAPATALIVFYFFFNPDLIARFLSVATQSQASWWSSGPHRLRSFFAFLGGCGVVTAVWPWLLVKGKTRWLVAAGAVLLFVPALDFPVAVRFIDRLTGALMASGAALALIFAFSRESRARKGFALFGPWLATAGLFQFFYWSIMARMTLFMLPPLIFLMAERFESSWPAGELKKIYGASLAATLCVSLPLAAVDYRYAAAQKEFALNVASMFIPKGRTVWYSGYMGLAHYLGEAGGRGLDASAGGWDLARPGDAVVVLGINSARVKPSHPILSDVMTSELPCAIPLRLMSGWTGEGGFYSNLSGFLPYSLSREPLETFTVVQLK